MRIFAFDLIRVVAILLILLVHTVALLPLRPGNLPENLPLLLIGQLGTGLFFLLSGALMLPRERDRAFPWHWRRVGQFLFLIVFWSLLSNMVLYRADGAGIEEAVLHAVSANNALVGGDTGAAGQLWYLWSAVALYLSLPFLGRMTQGLRGWEYVAFAVLTCLLVLVPGTFDAERAHRTLLDPLAENVYGEVPLYGSILAWFLLGDFFVRFRVAEVFRRRVPFAGTFVLLLLALTVFFAGAMEVSLMHAAGKAEMYLPVHLYPRSLFLFAGSALLFLLLLVWAPHFSRCARLMEALSRDVFGVFLVHMIPLLLLPKALASFGVTVAQPLPFGAFVYFGTAIVSFSLAAILRRVRGLRFLVS